MKKLSWRAKVLLAAVAEPGIGRTFIPRAGSGNWCAALKEHVYLYGPGDARILKSFAARGLVRMAPKLGAYACEVTEDGMLLYEREVRAEVSRA